LHTKKTDNLKTKLQIQERKQKNKKNKITRLKIGGGYDASYVPPPTHIQRGGSIKQGARI
jgi:hypothetical protein